VKALAALVAEHEVTRIVVGLPINMDGSVGPAAKAVQAFCDVVAAEVGVPVETWDERLTSYQANAHLAEAGMHWRERKRHADQVAAALILQGWLDARRSAD
jgi:putative Holliday junction resolvase